MIYFHVSSLILFDFSSGYIASSSIKILMSEFYCENVLVVTLFVTTFASLYIINTQPLIFTKDIYYDQKTFT